MLPLRESNAFLFFYELLSKIILKIVCHRSVSFYISDEKELKNFLSDEIGELMRVAFFCQSFFYFENPHRQEIIPGVSNHKSDHMSQQASVLYEFECLLQDLGFSINIG